VRETCRVARAVYVDIPPPGGDDGARLYLVKFLTASDRFVVRRVPVKVCVCAYVHVCVMCAWVLCSRTRVMAHTSRTHITHAQRVELARNASFVLTLPIAKAKSASPSVTSSEVLRVCVWHGSQASAVERRRAMQVPVMCVVCAWVYVHMCVRVMVLRL
jgi:hypothetical protein